MKPSEIITDIELIRKNRKSESFIITKPKMFSFTDIVFLIKYLDDERDKRFIDRQEILEKIDKIIKDNLHSKHHNCLFGDLKKEIKNEF